jgi:hypothetical protein
LLIGQTNRFSIVFNEAVDICHFRAVSRGLTIIGTFWRTNEKLDFLPAFCLNFFGLRVGGQLVSVGISPRRAV